MKDGSKYMGYFENDTTKGFGIMTKLINNKGNKYIFCQKNYLVSL